MAIFTQDIPVGPNLISADIPRMEQNFEYLFNRTVLSAKVINIGNWDMNADSFVTLAHGLDFTNIRNIRVLIRNDDNDLYHEFRARIAT